MSLKGKKDTNKSSDYDLDELFDLMDTCKLSFRTLEDIDKLTFFVMTYFKDRKKVLTGFYALALNAVEHGILNIGYERKAELLAEDKWHEEVQERLQSEKYKGRQAEFVLSKKENGTYLIITDPGDGFDWKKFVNVDPTRSGQSHGRGITLAKNLSFDKLTYNDPGNQVVALVSDKNEFTW